jgi:hypothetical protein
VHNVDVPHQLLPYCPALGGPVTQGRMLVGQGGAILQGQGTGRKASTGGKEGW